MSIPKLKELTSLRVFLDYKPVEDMAMFLPGSRRANDTLEQGFLRWAAF